MQAVGNLVGNAIKFTPRGGKVTLAVNRDDNSVRFRVEDTGVGIAPENIPRLFDRFWQADGSSQTGQGRGLGLAIARHIVEAHAGTLRVSSEGVGKGTTFVVELPLS